MRGLDPAYAYWHEDNLYLNLTNRCPTRCSFCVKGRWKGEYRGWDLRLGANEPSAGDAWIQALDLMVDRTPKELVFCGYGEPAYRLPDLLRLCRWARAGAPAAKIRLNTVGLGNLIWDRDITPDLAWHLGAVSVSLNTADPKQWKELHRPLTRFARKGFDSVVQFIERSALSGLQTTVTAVEQAGVDSLKVQELAHYLGASFRARPLLA